MGDHEGDGGGCPWRSVGGGIFPEGIPALQGLLALEALDSIWKTALRELEGKRTDWV